MKFLIVNSFHRDDKGDAALVHILIDQLLMINPRADIIIASMEDPREHQTFYRGRNVGSFELYSSSRMHPGVSHLFFKTYIIAALWILTNTGGRFSWLLSKDLKKIYNECATADLVVSVGGGYFLTKRGPGSRIHLFFALETLMLCKALGRKVVTAPVSVGPFENPREAHYASRSLQKLDLVLLREDISKQYFVDKNGDLPHNVKRAPDSAFALSVKGVFDLRSVAGAKGNDQVLAIAVRNWARRGNQKAYEQAHADLIDYVAEKYPRIRPVFIPQCTFPYDDDDDRETARVIMKLSRTKNAVVITEHLDYQQVKVAYKHADFVVGTRFHSMVFALSDGVPGIAVEYEPKTRGIMRDLGLEQWVIPIGSIDSKTLIALFDKLTEERDSYKSLLTKIMPKYIASANRPIDFYANIVRG